MSPHTGVTPQVRAVLSAPRGRRFSRTAHPTPGTQTPRTPVAHTQTQRPPTRTHDDPWTSHSQEYTRLAHAAYLRAARRQEHRRQAREASAASAYPQDPWKSTPTPQPPPPSIPRPRTAPDDGPLPPARPQRPPLPKRPRSHRKPRRVGRRVAWRLVGYTLAALAGGLVHHLTAGLF